MSLPVDEYNTGGNSADEYDALTPEKQADLQAWIARAIMPGTGRAKHADYTSDTLKQCYERVRDTDDDQHGHDISNGAFKGAMRAAGYEPIDPTALNWTFRIQPRCPLTIRQRAARFWGYSIRRDYPYLTNWAGTEWAKAAAERRAAVQARESAEWDAYKAEIAGHNVR